MFIVHLLDVKLVAKPPGLRGQERFQLLRRLETKYAKCIDELIAYRAGLDEQEKLLQGAEDERESLESEPRSSKFASNFTPDTGRPTR